MDPPFRGKNQTVYHSYQPLVTESLPLGKNVPSVVRKALGVVHHHVDPHCAWPEGRPFPSVISL